MQLDSEDSQQPTQARAEAAGAAGPRSADSPPQAPPAAAEEAMATVLRLVAQGLTLDRELLRDLLDLGAERIAEMMELKRRVAHALFSAVPLVVEAMPERAGEITELVEDLQRSNLAVEGALDAARRRLARELGAKWQEQAAAAAYRGPKPRRKAA